MNSIKWIHSFKIVQSVCFVCTRWFIKCIRSIYTVERTTTSILYRVSWSSLMFDLCLGLARKCKWSAVKYRVEINPIVGWYAQCVWNSTTARKINGYCRIADRVTTSASTSGKLCLNKRHNSAIWMKGAGKKWSFHVEYEESTKKDDKQIKNKRVWFRFDGCRCACNFRLCC